MKVYSCLFFKTLILTHPQTRKQLLKFKNTTTKSRPLTAATVYITVLDDVNRSYRPCRACHNTTDS